MPSRSGVPTETMPAPAQPARSFGAWWHRPAREALCGLLRGVRCGSISVQLPSGERIEVRGTQAGPQASIVLLKWRALVRLLLRGDIGLAESYRDGEWCSPDLTALLLFGERQQGDWAARLEGTWPQRQLFRLLHLAHANTRRGSRQNIAFHYDLGNRFYALWLDPELIYSSALYGADGAAGADTTTLEAAQAAKLGRVMALLRLDELPPDAPVLEIGCGWGALALAIARRHRGPVTGLTLSAQQLAHARERACSEGAAGQLAFRLQDYRELRGQYARIVSIEMLEAVGERYWPLYFETLRRSLRPGGIAVIQVITIADAHFAHYRSGADFIQRFIFPGGMLPSPGALQACAGAAGLRLQESESFGSSYAATLVEWRRRFLAAWPQIEALGFDVGFRRLWEYYLCYCEAGFRSGKVDVKLYTLTHASDQ